MTTAKGGGFLISLKRAKEDRVSLGKTGLQVRAVRIPLATGEQEILITNLAKAEMGHEAFGELYRKRRGIETKGKERKQKLETGNFSGRLADNARQDFHAMIAAANMLASCVREANRKAKKKRERGMIGPLKKATADDSKEQGGYNPRKIINDAGKVAESWYREPPAIRGSSQALISLEPTLVLLASFWVGMKKMGKGTSGR
jgi:hypothetical protein